MTPLRKKSELRQKASLLKWLFYPFELSEITSVTQNHVLSSYWFIINQSTILNLSVSINSQSPYQNTEYCLIGPSQSSSTLWHCCYVWISLRTKKILHESCNFLHKKKCEQNCFYNVLFVRWIFFATIVIWINTCSKLIWTCDFHTLTLQSLLNKYVSNSYQGRTGYKH